MGFRTYFVQPFKIPTGSMEPTLYGITAEPQQGRGIMDHFPLSLVRLALFGDRYVEVHAARSGVIENLVQDGSHVYSLNGVVPRIRERMQWHFEPGDYVTKGQLLASGRIRSGDHIFVNKVRYNFTHPERGDVFVFNTHGVTHPQVQADTFYIKRMVGMPGETIALDPPYLVADHRRVIEPDVFKRQVFATEKGYNGYIFPPQNPRDLSSPKPLLANRTSSLTLSDTQYLPLGDNTAHSLDGRYFGGVERANIVGPAVIVYWPLSERWGRIR
jgi:signal peptidase I